MCLGHQLLATAQGGEVGTAALPEVGVFDVEMTADGKAHPFFDGLEKSHRVMQWHHAEVKRAPQGALVLAHSPAAAVQSLAIDTHALSTQFHCEFSAQTVATWSSLPSYIAMLEKDHGIGAYERL